MTVVAHARDRQVETGRGGAEAAGEEARMNKDASMATSEAVGSALDPPTAERSPLRQRAVQGLIILSAASGVLGVQLISPLLPAMQKSFGLSAAQTGSIVSSYSVAALLATLPSGFIADRVGSRRVLWWSLLLLGVSGLATIMVRTFSLLLAVRVVQGLAVAALVPLTIGLLIDVARPDRRAHAQSYRVAGMSAAEFVLPLLAGLLFAATGRWQVPFLLFAIPVGLAGLVRRMLPQAEVEHTRLGRGQYLPQVREAVRDPEILSLFVVGFVRWWLKYGFFTFLPLYLYATLRTPIPEIGAVVAVQGLLGAIVSSQAGRIGTGRGARLTLVLATVVMGLSVAALPVLHHMWWAVLMCMLLGVADGLVGPLMNGLVGLLPAAAVRTTVIAMSGTGRNLGKAVGPSVIGVLVGAFGYSHAFLIAGAVGLAAPVYLRPLLTAPASRHA